MTPSARLLDAHAQLTAAIRSGEDWEQSYKQAPKAFRRLLAEEGRLQANAMSYLLDLSDRVPTIINWQDVHLRPELRASAVPPASDDAWKAEIAALSRAVADNIIELMVVGANSGEESYGIPLSINRLDTYILDAADKYTAELVSKVTDTTRDYIRQSIKRSIAEGDDVDVMVERIRKKVSSPVRAEMIAQTEAVNAYQMGLDRFAVESGAVSSTWDALSGACKFCAPLDGVTQPIGDYFRLGNGKEVKRPPGHTRCRCGRYLNYE